MMSLNEFDLIHHYFQRQQEDDPFLTLGIGDDCAFFSVPPDHFVAVSTDTLVEGTHFLPTISPEDLAYKALAVNMSDLAASGVTPKWLSLALTLPNIDQAWLHAFSQSLFTQLRQYHVQLIGGDTTRGGLSLTLTVQGFVPKGQQITRAGAKIGDSIYVTGYLGDSAEGFNQLHHKARHVNEDIAYLIQRHLRPTPRIEQGIALRLFASAMLDLSDGLGSDIKHIMVASHCGAKIELDQLPLSSSLLNVVSREQAYQRALNGGEDYELCFTIPKKIEHDFEVYFRQRNWFYQRIGEITAQHGQLILMERGQLVMIEAQGYDHFIDK